MEGFFVCVCDTRCVYIQFLWSVVLKITLLIFSHINEDKRKTEAQRQIFDVVYEVDGCPVSIHFW